jgi:hypothetical protein
LNIYIYGNNSFKKEIHETLEHSNIKFKLDDMSKIEDIDTLAELKRVIQDDPTDIYLIDDEKIIKKNTISQKLKFLSPKDGIEEEFLLDNGIADLCVDSLKEIPKYILKKYKELKLLEPQTDNQIIDPLDNSDDENFDIELDEELALLLSSSHEDKEHQVNLDELEGLLSKDEDEGEATLSKEELNSLIDFDEDLGLNNTESDYDKEFELQEEVPSLKENNILNEANLEEIEDIINSESTEGENMANDFSQLDSLNEEDILSALNIDSNKQNQKSKTNVSNEDISMNSSNVNDIAALISKLLNNKTLEITIKVKD